MQKRVLVCLYGIIGSSFLAAAQAGTRISLRWALHRNRTQTLAMGLVLVMLLSCCLCFKKDISLQTEITEMGVSLKKQNQKATEFKIHKLLRIVS